MYVENPGDPSVTELEAKRLKDSINGKTLSIEEHIKTNESINMIDMSVFYGLTKYSSFKLKLVSDPDALKNEVMRLRNLRAVNPDGIVENGSSVKILFGGGSEVEEREVSPYNPADVPFGSYIVQRRPHKITRPTPYDDHLADDNSSIVYWTGDSDSEQTYLE